MILLGLLLLVGTQAVFLGFWLSGVIGWSLLLVSIPAIFLGSCLFVSGAVDWVGRSIRNRRRSQVKSRR